MMNRLLLLGVHLLGAAATVSAFAPIAIAPQTTSSRSSFSSFRHVSPSCPIVLPENRPSSALAAIPGIAAIATPIAAIGATLATNIPKFYKAYPIAAGFLTAGTKAGLADSLAQYRDVCTTKYNKKRGFAMVMYSGLILGITVEIMYNRIFPIIFGPALAAGSTAAYTRAVRMTLLDAFFNAPLIWLPPAYIAQAIVYGYPKREAIQKYITDVKENGLMKKYWSLWLPMSMINFCFVPAHFRTAFVAGVSFFWMIILSVVANNGDAKDPESCPLEPELVDPLEAL